MPPISPHLAASVPPGVAGPRGWVCTNSGGPRPDRTSQAEDADEVRQDLAAIWRLELGALLRQHPGAEDELRTLVVRVWETLPTAQQTWVRINIVRNQSTQYGTFKKGT